VSVDRGESLDRRPSAVDGGHVFATLKN